MDACRAGGGLRDHGLGGATFHVVRFEGGKVIVTPNEGGASGFTRVKIVERH